MKKHALVLGLLAAVALPAAAEGLYVFGDIGQSKYSGEFDDSDTAVAVGLGYNLNNNFSFELGYHDLGAADLSASIYTGSGIVTVKGSADVTVIEASALAKIPVSESFDIYGRLGYGRIEVEAHAKGYNIDASETENKALYGVGAAYKVNEKVALRTDYIKFIDTEVSSFTVGVTYAF